MTANEENISSKTSKRMKDTDCELIPTDHNDDINIAEGDDNSLSSITSVTVTASSQMSNTHDSPGEVNPNLGVHDLIENLKRFLQKLQRRDDMLHDISVAFQLCDLLDAKYRQEVALSEESHRVSTDELFNQLDIAKTKHKEQLLLIEALEKKCEQLNSAQHDNGLLNEYIQNADSYHSQQVGELKAKLSLTRIKSELETKNNVTADIQMEMEDVKTKKRRKSSLRFWRKSSKSLISLEHNKSLDIIVKDINNNVIDKTMEKEIEEKCIKIEELVTKCNDQERRGDLLETTIQNKAIEIFEYKKRIEKLQAQVKSLSSTNSQCCMLLDEIDNVVQATCKEMSYLEQECLKNRQETQKYHEKLERLDWNIKSLSEENKILLSKCSQKNYLLKHEQVKYETLVQDLKSHIKKLYTKVDKESTDVDKLFRDEGIRGVFKLMENFSTLIRRKARNKDQSSQVNKEDMPCEFHHQQIDNSNINENFVEKQHSENILKELVSYVKYAKNREIDHYKKDMAKLLKENFLFKESLERCYKNIKTLQNEVEYCKSIHISSISSCMVPSTKQNQFEGKNKSPEFPKKNCRVVYNRKDRRTSSRDNADRSSVCKTSQAQLKHIDDQIPFSVPIRTEWDHANDDMTRKSPDALFLNSYHAGSSLINKIFTEKDKLEEELNQSRDVVTRRKLTLK
ncbi:outer dense fiber protein 2-like isoform X2 [Hydractinia symbiolongicarpus]|nr:outer dense fiber protein 2-like isoform X2 [Hydractinia symbiolongicarpus]